MCPLFWKLSNILALMPPPFSLFFIQSTQEKKNCTKILTQMWTTMRRPQNGLRFNKLNAIEKWKRVGNYTFFLDLGWDSYILGTYIHLNNLYTQ